MTCSDKQPIDDDGEMDEMNELFQIRMNRLMRRGCNNSARMLNGMKRQRRKAKPETRAKRDSAEALRLAAK